MTRREKQIWNDALEALRKKLIEQGDMRVVMEVEHCIEMVKMRKTEHKS